MKLDLTQKIADWVECPVCNRTKEDKAGNPCSRCLGLGSILVDRKK